MLTTVAFLHGDRVCHLIGSDIDPEAVALAERNLGLLTPPGLEARIAMLTALGDRYGKASHAEALAHAIGLRDRLRTLTSAGPFTTQVFVANAMEAGDVRRHLAESGVDLVLTDVPYGRHVAWQFAGGHSDHVLEPAGQMLDALLPVLSRTAVVAIAGNRQQKAAHPNYRRAGQLRIGKRHVAFLVPIRHEDGHTLA